ncbi:hypothetical protein C2857_004186 [Epichloe festucae Fl1]|uniref:Uncharacterized protein n=1 Tax=Epichloe festucae (strain Fl1) TaxID=877507 RepID=A0A7S9KP16_EPIFF|nr:hypothetical protein C2857_004186 [Epichloe festucae Fl1]
MKFLTVMSAFLPTKVVCESVDGYKMSLGRSELDSSTAIVFPWSEVSNHTGVVPTEYLSSHEDDFACPKGRGPNPLDCPATMTEIAALAKGGFIDVAAESCVSISKACCEVLVCAPSGEKVHVKSEEVMGRMWSPLAIKCVSGGRGGLWHDKDIKLYIQMSRPVVEELCAA